MAHNITRSPFPNSKKIYVEGKIHPINVAMREIELSPTKLSNGTLEHNPPVTVYDTSGPYTDENSEINIEKGLPRIREQWILDRNDVEILDGITSEYGKVRLADSKLDELRFSYNHKPKVAKAGKEVTQLYYANRASLPPKWNILQSGKTSE
jgi:phosphomethylpyrimidine synthase